MPNNDKTGPSGNGPMTGRGLGICDKTTVLKDAQRGRRGHGRGLGRGRRSV